MASRLGNFSDFSENGKNFEIKSSINKICKICTSNNFRQLLLLKMTRKKRLGVNILPIIGAINFRSLPQLGGTYGIIHEDSKNAKIIKIFQPEVGQMGFKLGYSCLISRVLPNTFKRLTLKTRLIKKFSNSKLSFQTCQNYDQKLLKMMRMNLTTNVHMTKKRI